jgi:hypothetical protein
VTTDVDVISNPVTGLVGASAGLIAIATPSQIGFGAPAGSLTISDSHVLGDNAGVVSSGLVAGVLPLDFGPLLMAVSPALKNL